MISLKNLKLLIVIFVPLIFLNACNGKLPGGDARKVDPNPKNRVAKNIEEGRGFRLMDKIKTGGSGNFQFANSNPLWKATLDTVDFMPLVSVNYSGGIIITDWYSTKNDNKSIKISIRFLSNEIRSDALNIKVFSRNCKTQSNCVITEKSENLILELNSKILKTAAIYKKQEKDKNFKAYEGNTSNK
tara:strand:- start:290 stop:850 length:561 start_codon:yes stop_codon:yes gene_type:complete